MENNEIREQPNLDSEVQKDCVDGTAISSGDGSLGKFKDAESLLNAYNNLQAEFTKKCQKLSALENSNKKVVYEENDWNKRVMLFLEKNPEAKKYSKDISETILNNPELKNKENALELAWSGIAMKKYVEPEKLANDKTFLNSYIFNNEEIKKQVLQNYLKELKQAPPVISGPNGAKLSSKEQFNPRNLNDAKKLAEKFFK